MEMKMKFPRGKYTAKQREWCERYESETGFEPLMSDFEGGHETFVAAAKKSTGWFESWASDAYLRITKGCIPGDDWVDEDTGDPRVTPRPAPHKKPPALPPNAELCGGPSGPSERAPGSASD